MQLAVGNRGRGRSIGMMTALLALFMAFVPALAFAGNGGSEFTPLYDKLKGYSQGVLGKVIALAFFLVGMGIGIVKQSVIAVVVGVGAALILVYGPDVIDSMFTATLPLV